MAFTFEVRRKVWVAPFGLRDLRKHSLATWSSRGWVCASGHRRTAAGSNFPGHTCVATTHHSEPPSRGGALFCPLLAAAEANVEGAIVGYGCGG